MFASLILRSLCMVCAHLGPQMFSCLWFTISEGLNVICIWLFERKKPHSFWGKKTCLRNGMYGVAHMLLLKHNLMHWATTAVCQCAAGSWKKMKQSFGEERQWPVILTLWDQKFMGIQTCLCINFHFGIWNNAYF